MPAVDWTALITGAGMTLAAHPFSYVKTLIQLGYEPLPPVLKKDMFFRKRFLYPGVFEYMGHIKNQDGFIGLYRGVVPRICANATMSITYGILKQSLTPKDEVGVTEEEQDFRAVVTSVTKESISRCTAVILSHPFHVIAIRTMASHIGNDPIFSTIYGASAQTYNDEGILGFFAGLLPRLAHEMATLWMAEMLAYLINAYIITEKGELRDVRNYVPIATNYVSQGTCYPISLVSTVMACNGASMMAGRPPFVSYYDDWYSCLRDLKCKGVEKRGSGMMFRAAILPRTLDCSHTTTLSQQSPYISEVLPLPDSPKID